MTETLKFCTTSYMHNMVLSRKKNIYFRDQAFEEILFGRLALRAFMAGPFMLDSSPRSTSVIQSKARSNAVPFYIVGHTLAQTEFVLFSRFMCVFVLDLVSRHLLFSLFFGASRGHRWTSSSILFPDDTLHFWQ